MSARVPAALAQLLTELGVDPARARLTRRRVAGEPTYLCLPSPDQPRLLVPLERWAGGMVEDRRARRARARITKQVTSLALAAGLVPFAPVRRLRVEDPALDELVRWLTGSTTPRIGVLSGPPRANRKPVLRVFTESGSTVGYAKVGSTPLAASLVRHETEALATLAMAGLTSMRVPQVLKSGVWHERDVLLTSPLAAADRQPTDLPVAPTRELFGLGARRDLPLRATSVFAPGQPDADLGAAGPELQKQGDRLLSALGDRRLPVGAAHGDWTPWNTAWTDGVLEAWDWERFATDLPAGHDVVHFEASRVLSHDTAPGERRLLAELPGQLGRCGVDPALARPLLALYLLVVGRRYAADLAREHVSSGSARLDWVLRLLREETEQVERGVSR